MTTPPSNPGIIILLIIAGLILFFTGGEAIFESSIGYPSLLLGLVSGLVAGGIAYAAFRSPAESQPMMWVAFFVSMPGLVFLSIQATGDDDAIGGLFIGQLVAWLSMPFWLALANQRDAQAQAAEATA